GLRMKILMHPCWLAPPAGEGTTMTSARVVPPLVVVDLTMSNSPSRSRGAFLRPGFATLLHSPRVEGWAERRETFGRVRGTRGTRHNAACQALASLALRIVFARFFSHPRRKERMSHQKG